MKRLLLPLLSLTFLLSACGLSDLEKQYYAIHQELIDDIVEIYKKEANSLKQQAYEFKRKGNAIGTRMYANEALNYNLKIMELSRYGLCISGKLREELNFKEGKRQCVSEIGIDPSKPSF